MPQQPALDQTAQGSEAEAEVWADVTDSAALRLRCTGAALQCSLTDQPESFIAEAQ